MESEEELDESELDETLLVDVRTRQEFAMGSYPGAINIPLDELGFRAQELGHRNREIVLFCAKGVRSQYGLQILKHAGFQNVINGGSLQEMLGEVLRYNRTGL